ncbi:hypothetical protein J1C56_13460 [Aminobacter anthyllidis]|uniref:Uncharacterized protein n=1 Tax=Aminobacter anthyllidis TaxID=1035067 RepID=A0A9X1D6C8_9HYPH|nr:hypothetical protein [Aminobacter anthyllidis]MBT1156603.1 hypothetical protein [Aminobacter anthyllidis]
MSFSLGRHLAAGLLSTSLALGAFVLPARALTVEEAGKVVRLLGELEPELGRLAYDEEEADQWFDDDAGLEGRIAKAGFTRESWKEALGATFRGYLASIATERFEATFSGLVEKVDASDLNAEQKAEMRSFVVEKIAETRALRAEGAQHLGAVQPYAARLNELLGDEEE